VVTAWPGDRRRRDAYAAAVQDQGEEEP